MTKPSLKKKEITSNDQPQENDHESQDLPQENNQIQDMPQEKDHESQSLERIQAKPAIKKYMKEITRTCVQMTVDSQTL